ncbi:hypothetical protein ACQ4PT_003358 [Festuca glaucescens]
MQQVGSREDEHHRQGSHQAVRWRGGEVVRLGWVEHGASSGMRWAHHMVICTPRTFTSTVKMPEMSLARTTVLYLVYAVAYGFGLKQRSPRSCMVDLRWNNCFLALNKMEGGTKVPGMICSKQPSKWTSKDRFAAKRLRAVVDKLDSDKRAIIEQKSAFRSLLNVSPFNIPNELIDYVAQHTSPVLREFKVGKKRIVFTKDMVTKVFGIVSGCKPVVCLKRSEQSSLRDVYRGSNPRPDIPTTIKILTECDVTDEDTIVRSWDLLCMATVVDPRSSNHVGMDYLGSMSDRPKLMKPVDVPEVNPSASLNEWIVFLSSQELEKDQDPAAKQGHMHENKDKENNVPEVESDEYDSEDDEVPEAESEGDLLGDAADFICAAKVGNVPSHRAAPDVPQSVVMTDASCFGGDTVNGDNTADADLNTVAPMAEGGEPVTPIVPKSPAAMIIVSGSKDATTGPDTLAKKNSKEFVRIGRYFCSYKSFHDSLKPRQYLSSEDKLIVDPAAFDLDACMKELRNINSKFKVLKDDLLYFPIVKDGHWITCCINICFEEFHIFDSMKTAKDSSLLEQYALNLFANFNRLVKESGLSKINFDEYLLTSPDHPQQTTLFDCGFFTQIFMENFDGKLMAHFDNNAIPDHRKLVAASLIENRDNGDDAVEAVMEEDLVKTKKK